MRRVHVEVAPAYDVVVGPGALSQLLPTAGRIAVVVDETVERFHGERIRAALADRRAVFTTLPSGERHKTLATLSSLYDWLAAHRIERAEHLVAVGGGVTGDLAGFAAATWQRGIPLVQVPTTLLAQVDASVGGKVAVDHPAGKNLIGAFHQPRQVLADTALLSTLPERERRSGLAEVVKTALLAGEPLMGLVSEHLDALAAGLAPLEEVIADCVAYKASVVQRDPQERGERAVLNLGHTVAHALEAVGEFEGLLHGEAVAHGLRIALAISGFDERSPERQLVARLKPPPVPPVEVSQVLEAMRTDKKVHGGEIRWVLLDRVGEPRWGCPLPVEKVRAALSSLLHAAR